MTHTCAFNFYQFYISFFVVCVLFNHILIHSPYKTIAMPTIYSILMFANSKILRFSLMRAEHRFGLLGLLSCDWVWNSAMSLLLKLFTIQMHVLLRWNFDFITLLNFLFFCPDAAECNEGSLMEQGCYPCVFLDK